MANRFTATEKWTDAWFCGLNEKDKLFWIYIVDNCNHAGIWQVNWPLVRFHIKDYVFNESAFRDRIKKLKDDKWFIPKFIEFQYKTGLNPENRAHASVIAILQKEGAYKPLTRGMEGRKDKDKDKDEKGGVGGDFDFEALWLKYPKKLGHNAAMRHFKASVKTEADYANIQLALTNFLASKVCSGDPQYIPYGSTWFNNWKDWVNFVERPLNTDTHSLGWGEEAKL